MNTTTVRNHLHDNIQHTVSLDEDIPEGALLIGWIVIAEWMAPDGDRWLSRIDGGASSRALPAWQTQGYLHNSLHDAEGFIPTEDDDEDAEDE